MCHLVFKEKTFNRLHTTEQMLPQLERKRFWWRPDTTAVCLEIKDCYKLYLIKFSQQSLIILFLFALRVCSEDEREITEMSYHIFIKLHSRGQNVKDWLISTLPHCEIRNV